MKPAPDMFRAGARGPGAGPRPHPPCGDHPVTDVLGARLHGFRAAWLNESSQSLQSLSLLPDVGAGAVAGSGHPAALS